MPVLLAPDQAPSLEQLLGIVQQAGLPCSLVALKEPAPPIQGLGSLLHAGATELSFLSNPKLKAHLVTTRAAAVILRQSDFESLDFEPTFAVVLCEQPYAMYALLAQWFDEHRVNRLPKGVHPTAIIDATARLGEQVTIGAYTVIEAGVQIGNGTRIGAGCSIGANSIIGEQCLLHARVVLYHQVRIGKRCILHSGVVLGADGFGFAPDPRQKGAWAKISQIGAVELGDDVEIGANTTVDRGALDNTRIANGVKLDNQIMVGHNVHIGQHTAIAACTGIAGSTHIGERCIIGGAAMFSGHLHITDDVQISGGTAITADIKQSGHYTGVFPFADHHDWQRNAAALTQLATLRRRLRALERENNKE